MIASPQCCINEMSSQEKSCKTSLKLHIVQQRMSAFGHQLRALILGDYGDNQARLSEATLVSTGTISRLAREEVVPSIDTMHLFAKHLPIAQGAALYGAWLRDLIPARLRSEVGVWLARDVQSNALKQPAPPVFAQLDDATKEALGCLAQIALDDINAREAINSTYRFLRAMPIDASLENRRLANGVTAVPTGVSSTATKPEIQSSLAARSRVEAKRRQQSAE